MYLSLLLKIINGVSWPAKIMARLFKVKNHLIWKKKIISFYKYRMLSNRTQSLLTTSFGDAIPRK